VPLLYLDSSALVKLVVSEPETEALLEVLPEWPERISSALARVEVVRALARVAAGPAARQRAAAVLARVGLVAIDDAVLEVAARLRPPTLRSLDAVHLATALSVGDELGAFVTYDDRLAAAAGRARLRVLSPR
jgi:predicted nucleic acid-binding protein